MDDLVTRLHAAGATVSRDAATDLLLINGEYTVTVLLSRCRQTAAGSLRWLARMDQRLAPDITILARMDPANGRPVDYYLLPVIDIQAPTPGACPLRTSPGWRTRWRRWAGSSG